MDYLCAPMPFIIGIHSSYSSQIKKLPMEEALIFDLDHLSLSCSQVHQNDLFSVPKSLLYPLKYVLLNNLFHLSRLFFILLFFF